MKLKEVFYLIGLKPRPRKYGYEVVSFDMPIDGRVDYARWCHPREAERVLRQGEAEAVREFLRPGDVAIDIGAHTGDSTIPIALAAGSKGCVIALEPNPYVFPVLQKNSELNREKTNIIPLMFAATETDGSLEFEYSDPGFCNGGRHEGMSKWRHAHAFTLTVEGRNMEAYIRSNHADLIPRIRFIKIDAEGYDFQVLKSMRGLIEETRPFLKVEVFSGATKETREAMIGFLEDLGYTVYRIPDDHTYHGERIGPGDVLRWRHFDVFCVPEGIKA